MNPPQSERLRLPGPRVDQCCAGVGVLEGAGLIGAAAWAVRRFGSARLGGAVRGRQPRLAVIDYASVDARRQIGKGESRIADTPRPHMPEWACALRIDRVR